jgi:excisionase family DNA binding protein
MADLSVREVATRLATSDRTVRRWLATGQLAGTRSADGWTVSLAELDRYLATRSASPSTDGHLAADMASSMTELVRLVDRLQRENRDLAGLVGQLQERVSTLQTQLALPEPTSTQRPLERQSDAPAAEPSKGSDQPKRRWWWPW